MNETILELRSDGIGVMHIPFWFLGTDANKRDVRLERELVVTKPAGDDWTVGGLSRDERPTAHRSALGNAVSAVEHARARSVT